MKKVRYKNLWDGSKTGLRGKCVALNINPYYKKSKV